MKKNLLFTMLMICLYPITICANTGSINPTTLPSTIVVGSTVNIVLEYESDVECNLGIAIFQSKINSDEVDWSKYTNAISITGLAATSGTPVQISENFDIGSIPLTSDLEEGRKYIWCFDLSAGGVGYSWNNNGATNAFTVTAPTTISNWIHSLEGYDISFEQGETRDINFDYIIEQDSKFKVSVTHFTTSWSFIGEIASTTSGVLTANTDANAITNAISITIPTETTPTANLTDEMYRINIIMLDANNDSEISNIGMNFSVIQAIKTDISKKAAEAISLFPNPVKNNLNINGITANTKVDIMNLGGSLVKSFISAGTSASINVSDLTHGIYFVRTNSAIMKFIKQ